MKRYTRIFLRTMSSNNSTSFPTTRPTLLLRIKNPQDNASWEEFLTHHVPPMRSYAARAGLTPHETDDMVQDLLEYLLKKLPTFNYDPRRGSFRAWLFRQIFWRTQDQLRKRALFGGQGTPYVREGDDSVLEELPDLHAIQPDAVWDREVREGLVQLALERTKKQVDAKMFQAFDLRINQGKPFGEVARALGMSHPALYLAKHRVSSVLKREWRRLVMDYDY